MARPIIAFGILLCVRSNTAYEFPSLPPSRHAHWPFQPGLHCHHQPKKKRMSRTKNILSSSELLEQDSDPVASLEQLDDLVPRSKIAPLIKSKSNVKGLLQTAWHFGLLSASARIPNPVVSLLAMAFVSSFFFAGLHECVHRTAFATPRLNDALAHIFGFLCLRPACHYRYYHWQHHKYTGNTKLDAELLPGSFLDFPVNNLPSCVLYLSGLPFWLDAVTTTLKHAAGRANEIYLSKDKAKRDVIQEARLYLALYAILGVLGVGVPAIGQALRRYWNGPPFVDNRVYDSTC